LGFEHAGAPPTDPERFVLSRAAARRRVLAQPDAGSALGAAEPASIGGTP
jgi:hypothetical protein